MRPRNRRHRFEGGRASDDAHGRRGRAAHPAPGALCAVGVLAAPRAPGREKATQPVSGWRKTGEELSAGWRRVGEEVRRLG